MGIETELKCNYCRDPINEGASVCKSCGRNQNIYLNILFIV